jgi:hypothetical protein
MTVSSQASVGHSAKCHEAGFVSVLVSDIVHSFQLDSTRSFTTRTTIMFLERMAKIAYDVVIRYRNRDKVRSR